MNGIQILVDRKGLDPTAVSAEEAIRSLLGFGDRLAGLRRRRLLELCFDAPEEEFVDSALRYLRETTRLWNPNKERAWIRGAADSFEVDRNGARRSAPFGQPACDAQEWNHVLVWSAESRDLPADLARFFAWETLAGARCGELWSVSWHPGMDADARRRATNGVAVVRSRKDGLLVQPEYQDHLILEGGLPLPVFCVSR